MAITSHKIPHTSSIQPDSKWLIRWSYLIFKKLRFELLWIYFIFFRHADFYIFITYLFYILFARTMPPAVSRICTHDYISFSDTLRMYKDIFYITKRKIITISCEYTYAILFEEIEFRYVCLIDTCFISNIHRRAGMCYAGARVKSAARYMAAARYESI